MNRFALSSLLLAILASACSSGTGSPPSTGSSGMGGTTSSSSSSSSSGSGGPLHVVNARTSRPLAGENIRAAMSWTAYNEQLTDCLAPIEVNPPLDFSDPDDELVYQQLSTCAALFLEPTRDTESILLTGEASTFDIPITSVPSPAMVTGDDGGSLGVGSVLIYQDGNNNGLVDLVVPGSRESVDTVLGSSRAVDELSTQHTVVVWREGALSPLWKLFQGVYDCIDEPPQGFSVLTVQFDEWSGLPLCSVSVDATVDVVLRDSPAMRQLICLDGEPGPRFRYPSDPIPGDAVVECFNNETVYFSTTPDAVCPIIEHYDLVGCTDTSSEQACYDTMWDLVGNEPAWWPCDGPQDSIYITLNQGMPTLTTGSDVLFTMNFTNGSWRGSLDELSVVITLNEAGDTITLEGTSLQLNDNDNNGVINAGDSVIVSEPTGLSAFDPGSRPGLYPVAVHELGVAPRMLTSFYFTPVPLPQLPDQITIEATDLPATFTSGPDDLFRLTYVTGTPTFSLDEMTVDIAYSCEAPYTMGRANFRLVDNDADERFGAGDALEVFETTDLQPFAEFEGISFFHCLHLRVEAGFNYSQTIGYASWTGATLELTDHADFVTSNIDNLFTIHFIEGFGSVPADDIVVDVRAFSEITASFSIGDGVTLLDADQDGRFGLGDSLLVSEVANIDFENVSGGYSVYVYGESAGYLGSFSWTPDLF